MDEIGTFTFEDITEPISDKYTVLQREIPDEYIFLLHVEDLKLQFEFKLEKLPFVVCNNLKTLKLDRLHKLVELSLIQRWCPHLKELVISDCIIVDHTVTGLVMPNLTSFIYMHQSSSDFSMDSCTFPQLTHFQLLNNSHHRAMSTCLNFTAPNLRVFFIDRFHIEHLRITGFPNLISLTATNGIQRLTIEDCTRLRYLDLSNNKRLHDIKTITLHSLETIRCYRCDYLQKPPPYEDFQKRMESLKNVQDGEAHKCQTSMLDPGRSSGIFTSM